MLYIYGAAALILLGEEDRTSIDIDVAGPYSNVDFPDFTQAAVKAGLAVNPEEITETEYIEWASPLRLCLPPPRGSHPTTIWKGKKLSIVIAPVADLIASKLIRYDDIDQSDIQYLCVQTRLEYREIEKAVKELPEPFNKDQILLENLKNLETDMKIWMEKPSDRS